MNKNPREGLPAVTIRRAGEEDYSNFNRLFKQGDEYHALHEPERFQFPDGPARSQDYFLGLLNDSHTAVFFAELAAEIVGVLILQVRDPAPGSIQRPRRFILVDSLVVAEDYRHQGIGKVLMAQAECWAHEQGVDEMELSVFAFNADAIALNQKMGYRVVMHRMSKKLK